MMTRAEIAALTRSHHKTLAQHPDEAAIFAEWLQEQRPKVIVQIGVAAGSDSAVWCEVMPDLRIVAVDIDDNAGQNVGPLVESGRMRFFCPADSTKRETIDGVKAAAAEWGPIDILFIDGGHHIDTVMADYVNYGPLVKHGGLIAFHDTETWFEYPTCRCHVPAVWDALMRVHKPIFVSRGVGEDHVPFEGFGVIVKPETMT